MADINLTIKSNFEQASKDLKDFGAVTESTRKKLDKFVNEFKDESVKQFTDRQNRAAAAVKATRGSVASAKTEHRAYQREIERLIKRGLDPMDDALKPLIKRYKELEKEIKDNEAAQKKSQKTSALTVASFMYIGQTALSVARQIYTFGKDLVDAYAVQEQAEISLRNSIEATGHQADISMKEMKEYATSLQGVTLYGDEATLTAQGLLQSLADLDQDGLQSVTPAVMDFATKMGVDLKTAMTLVGKTLGSSTNALSRYGITIDMTGTKEEKLAELTEAMNSKFSGAAEAAASAASGAIPQLTNAFGDLKEAHGQWIMEGIEPGVRGLTELVKNMADAKIKAIELRDVIDEYKDTGRVSGSLDELIEKRQKLIDAQMKQGRNASMMNNEQIAQITAQIELAEKKAYQEASLNATRIMQLSAEAYAAEQKIVLDGIELSAEEELNKILESRLTTEEKQIKSLQEQIDLYSQYRDVTGVQELLNELIAERNGLLDVEAEKVEAATKKASEAAEARAQIWSDSFDAEVQRLADSKAANEDYNAQQLAAYDQLQEDKTAAAKQQAEDEKKLREEVMTQLYSSLNGLADAYFNYKLSLYDKDSTEYKDLQEKQFNYNKAKSAIDAGISGTVAAVKALELGPIAGPIAAAAIGTFAAAQVGFILAQQPPVFQTGTLPSGYTVPESSSAMGDPHYMRVNPGERVNVTPRGESGGAGTMNVNVIIDRDALYRYVNIGIRSGEINLSNANLVGAA